MNHYCTYFDRGFLIQGLALWRSLGTHDPLAKLWVLALDDFSADVLEHIGGPRLHVVRLAELEAADTGLRKAKTNRTRVEYYFTLSPCLPRWLLATHTEIERITYLDADLFFFRSPSVIHAAMDAAGASVLVTAHRFPAWLSHYERHGHFNVGVLSWKNDSAGRSCLDDWRERCLAWCFDRLEDGKYADQKYLDDWPARLDSALLVLPHAGVNIAPWNWMAASCTTDAAHPPGQNDRIGAPQVMAGAEPLVVFHFARFRPTAGDRWWQSGQLDYGVMPRGLRDAIYSPYWRALSAARAEISALRPGFDFPPLSSRLGREFWRALPLRLLFGGDWLRAGDRFFNLRFGAGRWSGQSLARLRTIFLRR
jgi:hypothetical protein